MEELGQKTVDFSTLARRASQDAYGSLKDLVEESKSTEKSDSEKKIGLLNFINKTRQRMLRLNVLAQWCQQALLVEQHQQIASTLSSHDTCFTQTADSLFLVHEGLQQARAPTYDVSSAIEVLITRTYNKLPKCLDGIGTQSALVGDERTSALKKIDILLRSKLLEISLPKEFSKVKVSDGTVLLRVDGEFEVHMTLGYRGHLSLWRILHLELLVGERSGVVKIEESRRHAIGDDLERRMAVVENPFVILYSVLHELSVALIIDIVVRQVQSLCQGRWKDAIRFELISDGITGQTTGSLQMGQNRETSATLKTTSSVKILYWLHFEKNVERHDYVSPFIQIEQGHDVSIKCLHSAFIIDPLTGKECEFSLDQGCIDVEKLLLRAISCTRYTRLLEVHNELMKHCEISRAANDVCFQCSGNKPYVEMKKEDTKSNTKEYGHTEVLRVRVHGSSYITVGINFRSGRFFLQSSRNTLAPSSLSECEDALNKGVVSAADVFKDLRRKIISDLFASTGRFLGLQVFEQNVAAMKIPEIALSRSDVLLMGFSQWGSSYYLLLEVDRDFKPLFSLVETQPENSGHSHSICESNKVICSKKIDINQIQMVEDKVNLSLLDWKKLVPTLPVVGCTNRTSKPDVLFCSDASAQIMGSTHSTFSSLVDEVFAHEKEIISPAFLTQDHISSSLGKSPAAASHLIGSDSSSYGSVPILDKNHRKRPLSDILRMIPSHQREEVRAAAYKRRKIPDSTVCHSPGSQEVCLSDVMVNSDRYTYGNLLADASKEHAPSGMYVMYLLHVVRHCCHSIKHARLINQMDALEIPSAEETGFADPSSCIWFRLPFASGNPWEQICLQLGKPGNMLWDVKVSDQHFRDLSELQKGSSTTTPWGCNVRIASKSDVDSHIDYDLDGIVLSYRCVEDDSIKKLVADLKRLSSARAFAIEVRKLLDDKLEESLLNTESKIPRGSDKTLDLIGKMSEQMKKSFRIEEVGLTSFRFSYTSSPSGVVTRFSVEWESGKEWCTMHISPDQFWPHTRFFEDFIDRGKVVSLLKCIHLTAEPLIYLAGATRASRVDPAFAFPITIPGAPIAKQNAFTPFQGLLPNSSLSNSPQDTAPLGSRILHNAATLVVSGKGTKGIFPSSLFPTDVSVIYRKPH